MSSQPVIDYLTKQIFIERNIVTYRSLSRELRLHVNTAKNELAIYHENAPYHSQTSAATYLLSGEVSAPDVSDEADMDFDIGVDVEGDFEYDGDEVPQTKMLLVNERDLDGAKFQFTRLDSIHVYSLCPSPIIDADLLCTPTQKVREADRGKDATEMVKIVGKTVSPNIKIVPATTKGKSTRQPVAGPSRLKSATANATSTSKPKEKPAVVVAEPTKEQAKVTADKPKEKAKPTGKLDFSKPKAKEKKTEEPAEAPKENEKARESTTTSTTESKGKKPKEKLEPPKRGTKRKSVLAMSDSEDDASSVAVSKPPSKSENLRLKKRTLLSDDEDDTPQPARKPQRNRISKAVDSDTENVQALMDIDDDEVMRVTKETPDSAETDDADEGDEKASAVDEDVDMDMDDSVSKKPKVKKRPQKKVVPVGSNGLKKKRVIKSRTKLDGKYTVTEDYSDYESVDEDEEPEPAPAKGKAKAKAPRKAKQEDGDDSPAPSPAPKLKPPAKSAPAKTTKSGKSGGAKGGQKQGSLAGFFTSKPKN